MTEKTMADVIWSHLERNGDDYDLAYSRSARACADDLAALLSAAGFGPVQEAKAEALEEAATVMDKSAEALVMIWGETPMRESAAATLSATRHEARRVRARAAAIRGEQ